MFRIARKGLVMMYLQEKGLRGRANSLSCGQATSYQLSFQAARLARHSVVHFLCIAPYLEISIRMPE